MLKIKFLVSLKNIGFIDYKLTIALKTNKMNNPRAELGASQGPRSVYTYCFHSELQLHNLRPSLSLCVIYLDSVFFDFWSNFVNFMNHSCIIYYLVGALSTLIRLNYYI